MLVGNVKACYDMNHTEEGEGLCLSYRSLNSYLLERFGEKTYKLALDGGFTCPTRDGTLDTRGCIFCAGGSGDFSIPAWRDPGKAVEHAKVLVAGKGAKRFIAYFQSFTGTYAPIERLRSLYMQTLHQPDIVALSIATRPDCLGDEGIHAAVTRSAGEALELAGQYGDDIVILGTTSVIAELKTRRGV